MKRKLITPERIVAFLRHAETSTAPFAEVCRQRGITEVTFYRSRRRFQGMTLSHAKYLKPVIDENTRLKKLLSGRDL
jgi:putative transposase